MQGLGLEQARLGGSWETLRQGLATPGYRNVSGTFPNRLLLNKITEVAQYSRSFFFQIELRRDALNKFIFAFYCKSTMNLIPIEPLSKLCKGSTMCK